jgi:hypothetical protein
VAANGQRKNPDGDWSLLSWRRAGSSGAEWPSPWPTRAADKGLEPPDRWVPEHRAGVVMCVRTDSSSEIIDWADPETAAEAIEQLYEGPCSPLCEWSDVRVWTRTRTAAHRQP